MLLYSNLISVFPHGVYVLSPQGADLSLSRFLNLLFSISFYSQAGLKDEPESPSASPLIPVAEDTLLVVNADCQGIGEIESHYMVQA